MSVDLELSPRTARARSTALRAVRARPAGWRLSGRPAMYLLASLIVSLLAAYAAPTPLYAVAVLAALLTLGRLSDYVGRRPVLLAALAVQAASLLVFAAADGVPELLAARVIQGLSTGAALCASGAGMLDIDRERGALANAAAPGMGTGSGALLSALAVRYLPAPTHLIYLALLGVLAVQAVGVAVMRETVTRSPGAAGALVPEIRLPRTVRAYVLTAAPVLFAVWALAGLYAALGPALVRALTGSASEVLGGLSLTLLAATAVIAVLLLRDASAHAVMITGIVALIGGVAITLLALTVKSPALFFAGTAISGVGFGSGFQGGIRTVVPRAAAHERAGVLSLLFIISYLGLGLPAVAAGFRIVHGGGLVGTARDYGVAVVLLALLAAGGLLRTGRRTGERTGLRTGRSVQSGS